MERVFLNDSRVLFEVVNPVGLGNDRGCLQT